MEIFVPYMVYLNWAEIVRSIPSSYGPTFTNYLLLNKNLSEHDRKQKPVQSQKKNVWVKFK